MRGPQDSASSVSEQPDFKTSSGSESVPFIQVKVGTPVTACWDYEAL
jgi:hypothetical protein